MAPGKAKKILIDIMGWVLMIVVGVLVWGYLFRNTFRRICGPDNLHPMRTIAIIIAGAMALRLALDLWLRRRNGT